MPQAIDKQWEESTWKARKLFTRKNNVLLAIILVIIALVTKVYVDTNTFKVNQVQFQSTKLPSGTEWSILQVSDVHNKAFGSDNERLLETINQLYADMIVITGDLVDRKTDSFDQVFALVEEIQQMNPNVFFVTGNHEWGNTNMEELLAGLLDRQVTILDNRNTQVTLGGVTLNLVGIDDASTNQENMDLAFAGIKEDRYTVLLSHSPGVVDTYHDISADLILSGHTHGGQVRFPLMGALVAPDQGLFPELEKGIYEVGDKQFLYIDSGLGTSVAPIRFLNQSQVSLITISSVE